jgi:hypothetical protein
MKRKKIYIVSHLDPSGERTQTLCNNHRSAMLCAANVMLDALPKLEDKRLYRRLSGHLEYGQYEDALLAWNDHHAKDVIYTAEIHVTTELLTRTSDYAVQERVEALKNETNAAFIRRMGGEDSRQLLLRVINQVFPQGKDQRTFSAQDMEMIASFFLDHGYVPPSEQ